MTESLHTEPAIARANGLELTYDTFGSRTAPPLLLIAGLGAQMVFWHEDFCLQLARRGYHVIRYDNRDIGMSSQLDDGGVPDINALIEAADRGEPLHVPYLLQDMAGDAACLLDALGVASAHVVGHSMGGMIGWEMAILHPERVRTLTVIGSTTGDPSLPSATPEALAALLTPYAPGRQGFIDGVRRTTRVLNGPRLPLDEQQITAFAERSFDRGLHPAGRARQFAAMLAYPPDRTQAMASITALVLVIQGAADPVVPLGCGEAVARAIPGARLVVIEAMGHVLAPAVWGAIIGEIARHAV